MSEILIVILVEKLKYHEEVEILNSSVSFLPIYLHNVNTSEESKRSGAILSLNWCTTI